MRHYGKNRWTQIQDCEERVKGKLDTLVKLANDSDDEVRFEVAMALGQVNSYESGMALIRS